MRRSTARWTPTSNSAQFFLTAFAYSPCISTMTDNPQRQKGRGKVIPALNIAIDSLNIVKEATSATPVNPVFGSVAILLTMIRVSSAHFEMKFPPFTHIQDTMANEQDYVDLGLSCADICKALERGMDGKSLNDLSKSVCDAINQLTMWVGLVVHIFRSSAHRSWDCRTVAEIQEKVLKRSERHGVSRFLHSRDDKDVITGWKSDLNRILHVFNVCSVYLRFAVADYSFLRLSWL